MRAFKEDNRSYPLAHYKRGNLLFYKQRSKNRGRGYEFGFPLPAEDREALHGYPKDWTKVLVEDVPPGKSEMVRCTAVGKGWHMPTVLTLWVLLCCDIFPTMVKASPVAALDASHIAFKSTVYDPDARDVFFEVNTWAEALDRLQPVLLPPALLDKAWQFLRQCNISLLRLFSGAPGLDIEALLDRSSLTQRKGSDAHTVPRFLESPEFHLAWAQSLDHPLNAIPPLESDLRFAAEGVIRLGPQASSFQDVAFAQLRVLARACEECDAWALAQRPVQHVDGMRPVFTAIMSAILSWPDRHLPPRLVKGFEVVGSVAPTGIYRPIEQKSKHPEAFLGEPAQQYVDGLEADKRVHPLAAVILAETDKERSLGLVGPEMSRGQCDEKWGVGCWRPVPRHVVLQDDKHRPIDDGKAGGHNAHTYMQETIVVCKGSLPVALAALLHSLALRIIGFIPPWLMPLLGTEDLWKGYRQLFSTVAHQAVTVVTFRKPCGRRVYVQVFGLNFGFGERGGPVLQVPTARSGCRPALLIAIPGCIL